MKKLYFYVTGQATSGNSKSNNGNLKKVAIVLGGLAALGFGLIILLFIKARMKKEEDY